MNIPNGVNRSPEVNTVKTDKYSNRVEKKTAPDEVSSVEHSNAVKTTDTQLHQTRNLSFKLNEESNTMYVEITNEKNEVVRTIPADENDPKFVDLLKNAKPGMIVDYRG